MKNLVITDTDLSLDLFKNSVVVNLNNIDCHTCDGNYSCLKREGRCRYNDDMNLINRWSSDSSLIILISHIIYGTFDIPMATMMERQIANFEPYYTVVDQKSARLNLSNSKKRILVIGYGDISEEEEQELREYIEVSGTLGFNASSVNLYTCTRAELEETLTTFGGVDLG